MLSKYLRFLLKEYFFTFFSIAFVIAYWVSAYNLRFTSTSLRYPFVISIGVGIMIIWNLIMSVKEFKEVYKAEGDEYKKWDCTFGFTKGKLIVIGATIFCVFLIPFLGYCVSTFLYLVGITFFLGERKPIKIIVYALVMTTLMYLVFKRWLMVNLPNGILI